MATHALSVTGASALAVSNELKKQGFKIPMQQVYNAMANAWDALPEKAKV